MTVPKTVVIVGGSLAGLLHGLYLKRHGSHVVILEQDPGAVRSSHNAGIAFGPAVEEVLRKYDATGVQSCTPSVATRIAYRKRQNFKELNVIRNLTSWGLLYRVLRANFDGLASEAVPNPPPAREGDGKAEYRAGQRVTKLQYENGAVTVGFVGQDGVEGSLTADLVIGADGMHSTVRALVQAPTVKEYSGYVAWRGTVRESELPPDVAEYFASRTCINLLKKTYIVSYAVPPDSGTFAPGTRLINWVWYYNIPDNSPALTEVLTDTAGRTHGNTVPSGLARAEIFRKHLATTLPAMAAPFAALLSSPGQQPFVTKVNDALTETAVFCDGKVVLVGDALAAFRPHFAVATEQAARHCLGLARVWDGEVTVQQWARDVTGYGKRMWLVSRVLGVFGLGGWRDFLRVLCVYVAFLVRLKLGKGPRGY
ncbi:zeaxanthin epoxidase, chloroplastic [Achaetomium macrosporum]|uniref:Zeaxanthin epoxidase, chloroplastic n=1 Tax=Achaetomium macrosporum TaxID=79813 RepID=A0AAN7C6Y3_9PEZI|nr:zeaxanthin epoxidase, chloroplastic [Achaetomium macrosporum]